MQEESRSDNYNDTILIIRPGH